jgi:hypothetical protein
VVGVHLVAAQARGRVTIDETAADVRASASKVLEPGAQIGKYRLGRLLGAGGMGQVWAAHDPDLDRDVALKLLRAENAAAQLRTRLLREARAMARLKHPNVLTVYEVGSVGDRDYIAMELVDGMNLDQWLATSPPKTDVWSALVAAGHGLAAAHRAGLVHRDFKPHNVLRSSDGRVLVTDFGLARGVGDEPVQPVPASLDTPIALDVTLDAQAKDSVLDSPLTQTGALIGTPAYMAPEQYAGSPPDPRTDQFAFCVTAWQALTGQRPFQGTSLDELRRQTSRGVANIKTSMPRGIRAVLVRGLDPDPNKRWGGIDDLIAALEPHSEQRRKQRQWGFGGVGLGVAALVVWFGIPHHEAKKPAASPYACKSPDEAFADAWTSERRTALENRVGAAASLVSRALDDLRHGWLDAYAAACAAPPSQATFAKLGCLLGERDEVSAFTRLADTLPTTTFDRLDPWGELPRVDACASDSPIAPPLLPEDRKQRDKIIALRAEVAALRLRDPQKLLEREAELTRAGKALGWSPLEPELDQAFGLAAQFLGRYDQARTHLVAAADHAAQLRDYRLEATARIGLLATENDETADPSDSQRETRLTSDARAAVHRAGDDPELSDTIDVLNASARISRGDFSGAHDLLQKDSWGAGVGTRAAIAQTAQRLRLSMVQGDYDEANALGQLHEQSQPQAGPAHAEIEKMMVQVAWGLGRLEDMHTRADKLYSPSASGDTVWLTGKVTDAHGAAIPHGHVVAWRYQLYSDAHRLFEAGDFDGAETTADANGEFSFFAPLHGAIMAERDDLRSLPILISDDKPTTLVLGPTHAIAGKITSAKTRPIVDAFVRIEVGGAAWFDRAPVDADGRFRIGTIPAGAATMGLVDHASLVHWIHNGAAHDGATPGWPGTATLDVVTARSGQVLVLHGHPRLRGVGSSPVYFGHPNDIALLGTTSIGFSSLTPDGQKIYKKGDVHALVHDTTPGDTTVCLVTSTDSKCVDATVPATGTLAVEIR